MVLLMDPRVSYKELGIWLSGLLLLFFSGEAANLSDFLIPFGLKLRPPLWSRYGGLFWALRWILTAMEGLSRWVHAVEALLQEIFVKAESSYLVAEIENLFLKVFCVRGVEQIVPPRP
jgi:hypothetical protein